MDSQSKLDKGVGTKEPKVLEAKPVVVKSVNVETQRKLDNSVVGDKVLFDCKHPDRDEHIQISKMIYKKKRGDKTELKTSGTWYNEDEDGLIMKKSALAALMNFYDKKTLKDFVGVEFQTEDDDGFLIIKAY